MSTPEAIIAICIGLPLLAVLIGTAIGSHFDTGSDDPHP